MKHKQGTQPHQGNTQRQTGDPPENPLHVKLVPKENESAPKPDTLRGGSQDKKKPTKWFGIPDWWVAGGTITLAAFAVGSFILLWQQLNDARKAFTGDERPWIEVRGNSQPVIAENQPPGISWLLTNRGKTPAKDIKAIFLVKKVMNDTPPNLDDWRVKSKPASSYYAGVAFPTGFDVVPTQRVRTKAGSTDVAEPDPLTGSEWKELSDGRAYLVFYGEMTYRDVYGVFHWTKYCTWKGLIPGNYTSRDCTAYNDTDKN